MANNNNLKFLWSLIFCMSTCAFSVMQAQTNPVETTVPESQPNFYLEISADPGFTKFKPVDQITFYQPNLKSHTGTGCQVFGACGLHLAAFQPAIDIGLQAGIQMSPKIAFSTGFYYSKVQAKLGIDGILYARDASDQIISNHLIDSVYAFTNTLYDLNEVIYKADYLMIPLLFHFYVPGDKFQAGIEIGIREYFLLKGDLSGDEHAVTIIHNSYGYGSDASLGNKTIDISAEMSPNFLALQLGAELSWHVKEHLNFQLHPFWIRGFSNVMTGYSNIFIAQYGSTSNFESGGDVVPLYQDFRFRKFGIGVGLQYQF